MSKADIVQRLGINEEVLQEWLDTLNSGIVKFGETENPSYALKRLVSGYSNFPIWEVLGAGQLVKMGELIPVFPEGYITLWDDGLLAGQRHYNRGLPWWLQDMRPQGFIGRAFVFLHAEQLNLPKDLKLWKDDDVLIALTQYGGDSSGSLLIGEKSFQVALKYYVSLLLRVDDFIGDKDFIRKVESYCLLARQTIDFEMIGSSAGGEQPKFAFISPAEKHVIVKFTANSNNNITQRWGSLLQAECIATRILRYAGIASAATYFLELNNQWFLEVERFDRVGLYGRKGLVSLAAVDSEFVGQADATWSIQAIELQKQGLISAEDAETMQKLEAFGRMIGNADMHLGNLSFFHEQTTNLRLAPVYDMLPMLFAPRASGHIPNEVPEIRLVTPPAIEHWQAMFPIALQYWQQILELPQPDESFKAIAVKFIERLQELKPKIGL
ncbi:MAG: type II toxin-antitoxin system HipA family toxin YjjJ [Thiofilum sp.]|nr:type II toxin-antitoxin system HipA family toxin YjjJ [Thiofilum sp.]